jgi:hypothetical protein
MFSWFKRFVRGHRNRYVFHYWDGSRYRSSDPLEIERGLVLVLGENWRQKLEDNAKPVHPELVGEEADKIRKDKEELRSRILYAIDTSFDVKSYKDGVGMTEIERFGLLTGFNRFCIDLVVMSRPFRKQQSRASPGSGDRPIASGAASTSPDNT